MANLAASQRLDWVIPGLPFGNGSDGVYSSATIPTLTKDSCSGTSGNATLTTTGSTFANGDILLLHQTRGTSAGVWEVAKVASGGGSTSLTLTKNKVNTYTDSGASQAQAIKIPQYTDVTVQSGTWTVPNWDGNVGGVFPIAVKGTMTVTGTIDASTKGFLGVSGVAYRQGEGTGGASAQSNAANGNGGGGADSTPYPRAGGGGGGNGGAGGTGGNGTGGGTGGTGGSAVGSADLITMDMGGAGGQCYQSNAVNGGGIVVVFAKSITINGAITNSGGSYSQYGGGGAGGSNLIECQTATLGSNILTASAGNGWPGDANNAANGNGGIGRISIHHSGAVTGTTSPTFDDTSEPTLVEASSSGTIRTLMGVGK